MRILKLLFSTIFFFFIVAVVGFFITREALLYWGTAKIRNSLRTLYLSESRGTFLDQCKQLGSSVVVGQDLVTYQLRFLSSKEFLLEAVCDQFSFRPILIEQVLLPQFVTKVPGTSGFILNPEQSGIELQVFVEEIDKISELLKIDLSNFIKTRTLVAEDGVIVSDSVKGFIGGGPVTSCDGYGYECCQQISQIGMGDRISGLADCGRTCYSSCVTRPVILSFNTDPIFDPRQRSLSIKSGNVVEFTYVADAGENATLGGILDFGDGKKLPVTGLAGQASHAYSCNKARCEYAAKLVLEDNWAVESADTNINTIQIVVGK